MKKRGNSISMVRFYDTRLCKALSCALSFFMLSIGVAPSLQAAQANKNINHSLEQSGEVRRLSDREMEGIVGGEEIDASASGAEEISSSTATDVSVSTNSYDNPTIYLTPQSPNGGGVQAGGGEMYKSILNGFNVDQFSGSATMRVPLEIPSGRNGIQPDLALTYRSGAGNSWCGVGWNLEIGHIIRLGSNKGTPKYNSTDKFFYVSNGSSMELINIGGSEYRAKSEGAFLRFTWSGGANLPWYLYDKSGNVYYFGENDASRTMGVKNSTDVTYIWHLNRLTDLNSNYFTVTYISDNRTKYLSRIDYTYPNNKYYITFSRESRNDNTPKYTAGFNGGDIVYLNPTSQRLKNITVYADNKIQRTYDLAYQYSPSSFDSRLISITQKDNIGTQIAPPIQFEYSKKVNGQWQEIMNNYQFAIDPSVMYNQGNKISTGDFNRDGKTDFINMHWVKTVTDIYYKMDCQLQVYFSNGDGSFNSGAIITLPAVLWESLPPRLLTVDINDDQISDIALHRQSGAMHLYTSNGSGGFTALTSFSFVAYNAPISFPDINNDNKADLVGWNAGQNKWDVRTGNGSGSFTFIGWQGYPLPYSPLWMDLNADGSVDHFYYKNDIGSYWNSRSGYGDGYGYDFTGSTLGTFAGGDLSHMMFGDFNGDGKLDIGGWNSSWNTWDIRSGGPGLNFTQVSMDTTKKYLGSFAGGDANMMQFGDFDGDGNTDIAGWNSGLKRWDIRVHPLGKADLLTKINSPIGGSLEISYGSSSAHPNTNLPFILFTVKDVTLSDGLDAAIEGEHEYKTEYQYSDGYYDYTTREFRGFGTSSKIGNNYCSKTWYHQDQSRQSKPYKTEYSEIGGNLLTKATYTWNAADLGNGRVFPYLSRSDNFISQGTDAEKQTAEIYTYDDYGNVIKISKLGDVAVTGDETYNFTDYIYNTSLWIVDKPKETRACSDDTGVNILAGKRFMYDGSGIEGEPWGTPPVKGLLKRVENYYDQVVDPALRWITIVEHYSYDSYGNIVSATDPKGNVASINYDPTKSFAISKTDPKGYIVTSAYYGVNSVAQDKGLYGQVKSQTDPNGATINYTYDTFGRPLKVWGPGDIETSPTKWWDYRQASLGNPGAQSMVEYSKAGIGQQYWTESYFDGMGRTMQSHKGSDGFGSTREIRTTVLYDAWNRPFKSSLPYSGTQGEDGIGYVSPGTDVNWVIGEYDGMGRVVKVTNPDGTYKSVSYEGLKTTKTDENGKSKVYEADVYGRLIKVTEKNGTAEYYTNYEYNPTGSLRTITKADNQQILFFYDSFGRKIKSTDPDRGTWEFEYDLAGNLVKQKDARGTETSFIYDNLNRITTKTNNDGIVGYAYDTGTNGIWRLKSVSDPSGNVYFDYNDKGQLVKEQRQFILGGVTKTYAIERRYNAAGQLDTLIYPDGEKVPYRYDEHGQITNVGTYAANLNYNNNGQMTGFNYGNGLAAGYVYNDNRLWLEQLKYGTSADPLSVLNMTYSYDNVGNVTNVNNNTNTLYWTLEYDDLYRLKKEACRNFVLNEYTDILLQTYYVNNYGYDGILGAVGNRTSLNGQVYSYLPGKNQLQTDGIRSFTYDANGNTITSNNGLYTTNYTFNTDNRLSQVSYPNNTVDYTYNSVGLRVKKVTTNITSGQVIDAVAVIDDPYNDLVSAAPTGDGHDDARDLGKIKVHSNNNYIFFEIDHKYLYGTNQGEYENLYIAIDTDHILGSGNMFFPDNSYTGIEAANAWEYCVYVYNEDNYGIYQQNLNQLEKPTVGGKKMKVNYVPSSNGKIKIQIPLELLGSPQDIRFVIMTTMPGTITTGTSIACDVAPGGMNSIVGGIVYGAEDYVLYMPGNYIKTVSTEYYLYDESGHVLCEIDGNGYLKTKYYYLNGQMLARSNIVGTTPDPVTPLNNSLDNQTYCADAYGSDSSVDCNFVTETADKKEGLASIKVMVTPGTTFGNFQLSDPNKLWKAQDYRYVHVWVKPSTGAQWLTFHISDYGADGTAPVGWRDMQNYTDGDVYFKVGKDLIANQWNELWIDLYKYTNLALLKEGYVKGFHIHSNCGATFLFDHFYTTANSGYDLAYYHNDHLGSPRAMTNAWGQVMWQQDYKAFGQDFDYSASGNKYKFNGKPLEANTGLYYYGARYYDPVIGRFVSCDPIIKLSQLGNPHSLNPYAYCMNSPQNYVDIQGMFFLEVFAFLKATWPIWGPAVIGWIASTINGNEQIKINISYGSSTNQIYINDPYYGQPVYGANTGDPSMQGRYATYKEDKERDLLAGIDPLLANAYYVMLGAGTYGCPDIQRAYYDPFRRMGINNKLSNFNPDNWAWAWQGWANLIYHMGLGSVNYLFYKSYGCSPQKASDYALISGFLLFEGCAEYYVNKWETSDLVADYIGIQATRMISSTAFYRKYLSWTEDFINWASTWGW